jgi:RNA 2',3'-cyclic 3'-phosphodiesterase
VRLFVALDLPDELRRALADVIERLKPTCREARWVRPETMHLTLKFIGHAVEDGDTQKLDAVRAALASVRSEHPIELCFHGVGFFPDARRPRVVWCGVKGSPNLARVVGEIEQALEPLGIPRDKREFVPHLTLARIESTRGADALARAAAELESRDFGSARETKFYIFESALKRTGAEYTKIEAYEFAKASE